ncbi:unnamed protein product, partial [Staurois parvus]
MLSLVCMAREVVFFWEGACDLHRANQHCPDRESRIMQPHRT